MLKNTVCSLLILLCAGLALGADKTSPQRIVSLAPSITRSLYLLGAQDRLIAVSIYCPPEAEAKEKIGTVYEPNIEKIVALRPDLIIAAKEGNIRQPVELMKKLGLNVYIVGTADGFDDACKSFLELGKVVGEENRAAEIIEKNRKKIAAIRAGIKSAKKPTIFWQVGAQPIFTAGKRSFVNDFMELAGGTNIFGDLKPRYPNISREEVIKRDPDIIMMVTTGDVTIEEKAKWQEYKSLKAVQTGNIYMLDDSIFTIPTPQAIADGVEITAKIIAQWGENK